MGHDRGTHAGSGIGRTRGEVTIFLMIGHGQFAFQDRSRLLGAVEGLLEIKPRLHRLDTDMVLLIDHDRNRLVAADHGAVERTVACLGQVFADQAFFSQGQPVFEAERVQIDKQVMPLAFGVVLEKMP